MKDDPPGFDELITSLRALLDLEYRRGQADAARRIIEAAQTEVSPTSLRGDGVVSVSATVVTAETRTASKSVENESKRSRAPAGLPDLLLQRVLGERGASGATAQEILAAARPGDEQMVSLSGIRFAFDRGRRTGKYRRDRGRWFLAEEEEARELDLAEGEN